MEIRAGTGGDEAALFARNLYEMYKRYCEIRRWKFEVMDSSPTELGGFKEITIGISGEGCYRDLQYESGGHRVQRVPETETKGRIHTSAATIAVLPEVEDLEIDLPTESYEVERYAASSGPGGQHVNKTASAVRITHHESGIVVKCFEERSQHKNLAKGLRLLKSKLYDHYQQTQKKERADQRSARQRRREEEHKGDQQDLHRDKAMARESKEDKADIVVHIVIYCFIFSLE